MKNSKSINYSLLISLCSIVIVTILTINITTRIALVEQRYNSLLNNTMSLVDNITKVLSSLESDRVIKQLTSKVASLRKENETLKGQAKNSEVELVNISKKEKKCQEKLAQLSGKHQKIAKEQDKEAKKKENVAGNRGFLIKSGKAVPQPSY